MWARFNKVGVRRVLDRKSRRRRRRGMILALFALFLIVLLGMVGLVVDLGVMRAAHRQAQNAADAAALAAAMDRMRGRSLEEATATATTFVQTYNGLTNAPAPTVNSPPSEASAYAGSNNYVEVIVTVPVRTYFISILGFGASQNVTASACAGYEPHAAGEGVMVLDPTARPGLDVSGGAAIRVKGRVVVNSEGGGRDEDDNPINNGNNGFAAKGGQPNSDSGIYAEIIDVVGGVDAPLSFKNYDPNLPSPLDAGALPEVDPLIELPTPATVDTGPGTNQNSTARGVDPTDRGEVSVTNSNVNGLSQDTGGANHKAVAGETLPGAPEGTVATDGQVILYPGIYSSMKITGGSVYLVPGIYVLSPKQNVSNALQITGGTVIAERIMFYNTAVTYNPDTGTPDRNDRESSAPLPNSEWAGGFSINAGMKFSPLDTTKVNYASLYTNPLTGTSAPAVSDKLDGMLFYQRRRHKQAVQIVGDSAEGQLTGTLYAKWANFQISGQGTYDAQFLAGSLSVTGLGDVTILGAGEGRGRANQVFLVE